MPGVFAVCSLRTFRRRVPSPGADRSWGSISGRPDSSAEVTPDTVFPLRVSGETELGLDLVGNTYYQCMLDPSISALLRVLQNSTKYPDFALEENSTIHCPDSGLLELHHLTNLSQFPDMGWIDWVY